MDIEDTWIVVEIIGGIIVITMTVIIGVMLCDYYVAHAQDPIAVSCAFGKQQSCEIIRARKS